MISMSHIADKLTSLQTWKEEMLYVYSGRVRFPEDVEHWGQISKNHHIMMHVISYSSRELIKKLEDSQRDDSLQTCNWSWPLFLSRDWRAEAGMISSVNQYFSSASERQFCEASFVYIIENENWISSYCCVRC